MTTPLEVYCPECNTRWQDDPKRQVELCPKCGAKGVVDFKKWFADVYSVGVKEEYQKKEMEVERALSSLPAIEAVTERTESALPINDQTLLPVVSFPFDVLPAKFLDFTGTVAEALNVEPHLTAITAITIVSAALGNTLRIVLKRGYEVAPFLWFALVKKTGYGGTHIIKTIMQPVYDLHNKEYQRYKTQLKIHKQALANWKKGDALPEEPYQVKLFSNDVTTETLIDIFMNNPRGIILYYDETAGWILSLDQYHGGKGNDLQRYLDAYDCKPWQIDRKGKSQYAPVTGLSIVTAIQPEILPTVFKNESFENGFISRLIFAFAKNPSLKLSDHDLDPSQMVYWQNLLEQFYNIELKIVDGKIQPIKLLLSPDASSLYKTFRKDIDGKLFALSGHAIGFVSKLVAYYTLKFAGILHALKTSLAIPIDAETMNGAIRLTNYFAGQVGRLLALYDKDAQTIDGQLGRLIDVLYDLQSKVEGGRLPLSTIKESYNNELPEAVCLSSKMIGSMLKKLNLRTEQGTGGFYYLIWDTPKIQNIFLKYKSTLSTLSTYTGNRVDLVDIVSDESHESGGF